MPAAFLRKRVNDLLRPRVSPSQTADNNSASTQQEEGDELRQGDGQSLLVQCFLAGLEGRRLQQPEVYFGKTGCDLPQLQLAPLSLSIVSAASGPDGGLTTVDGVRKKSIAHMANMDDEMYLSTDAEEEEERESERSRGEPSVATCYSLTPGEHSASRSAEDEIDWNELNEESAFGTSISLYERNPLTGVAAGTPIADVWGVCARENSCILALADGVNWGEGARLAARCAVRGAIDHLNRCIRQRVLSSTDDVFHEMLAAFHAAHSLILQEGGLLTTLCVALAAPVASSESWVLCVCNVGDSLCFVHSPVYGVREVTFGSHSADQMRDMRNAGGALGPVDGRNPQLHNLTCSETFIEPGDIVFITSDGISDNMDPVVGKFCVIKKKEESRLQTEGLPPQPNRRLSVCAVPSSSSLGGAFHRTRTCAASVPCVDAAQRHELMLLRMRDVINEKISCCHSHSTVSAEAVRSVTASSLCHSLVQFATQISQAKRRTLEDPELYKKEKLTKGEERSRRRMVRERLAHLPGKLDHASVVAYKVGHSSPQPPPANGLAATPSGEAENGELREATVEVEFCVEKLGRQHRAACSATVQQRDPEKAVAALEVSSPPSPPASPTSSTIRAPSPYEQIPMSICSGYGVSSSRGHHIRNSIGRHTVAVDVRWLKKLVTRKNCEGTSGGGLSARSNLQEENSRSRTFGDRLRGLLGSRRELPQTEQTTPVDDSSNQRPALPPELPSSARLVRNTTSASYV